MVLSRVYEAAVVGASHLADRGRDRRMRIMFRHSLAMMVIAAAVAAAPVRAHQPTMSDGTAVSADTALEFDDIQLSRVVYHEVTETAAQLWLTFDIATPQSLRVSLGVPLIDRLADFRPAFAVFGPNMPAVDVPLAVPDGLGGVDYRTDEVVDPEVFNEPFSGTSSWILAEKDVELPAAGTYYIAAYVPSGELGKLWLAPGVREEFSLRDIAQLREILPEVRAFHEVPPRRFCGTLSLSLVPMFAAIPLARLARCRKKQ